MATIAERIRQLESAKEGDASARPKLLEAYRQLQQSIQKAEAQRTRLEDRQRLLETGAAEVKQLKEQLMSMGTASVSNHVQQASLLVTVENAQNRIRQEEGVLQGLRMAEMELAKQLATLESRSVQARNRIAEIKSSLAQMEGTKAAPPAAEPTEQDQVALWLHAQRGVTLQLELRALEAEVQSLPLEVEVVAARRNLAARQVSASEARLKAFENRIAELRKMEGEQALAEAERLKREAEGKHRLLQAEAEEIARLSREVQSLGPLIEKASRLASKTEQRREQLQADMEEVQRVLDLGRLTDEVATVFLEQRNILPSEGKLHQNVTQATADKSEIRLKIFRVDRQLRQLEDLDGMVSELMSGAEDLPSGEEYREQIAKELRELLQLRRGQVEQLAKTYRDYLKELTQLETAHLELEKLTNQLRVLLDENLLWIRNAPSMTLTVLKTLPGRMASLLVDSRWSVPLTALLADATSRVLPWLGLLLLLAACLGFRARMIGNLGKRAGDIGKVGKDQIWNTVIALVITLCIASPVAILLAFLGWRVALQPGEFAQPVGSALLYVGGVFLVVRFVKALCRPQGVCAEHFGWNAKNMAVLRKHLTWFLPFVAICGFFIVFTELLGDTGRRNGTGRVAFILLMFSTCALMLMVFHPAKGLQVIPGAEGPSLWQKTRPAWRPVLSGLPLILAGLAAGGFYYMALAFGERMGQTLALILFVALLQSFLLRWLAISQRRLDFKVAMERRQAQLRSREEDEDDVQDLDPMDLLEEVDVAELKEQTLELLRMSMVLIFAVGLWVIWAEVLPAFRVFDKVGLWDHTVMVDGVETLSEITLSNLLMSMVIVVFTILAARNLPGFLEIAILQRLPVDQGTRYAVRTLSLYAITSMGIAFAFNAIGIGWSSVQWLVAALTVGLGFGLQEIFGNFVSGLIILLERPIRVGDTVTVGNISGVVTQIRMRATTITDWNRKELVVPNKTFITGELINWSLSDPILRMDFTVGIAYGSDTTLAHKTMMEVCKAHPMVMTQPEPTVFFTGFGDNSLNFDVRVFLTETNNSARTRVIHELHMAIDKAFREHDICIAFPQRDVHLDTLKPLEIKMVRLKEKDGQKPSQTEE